MSQEHPAEEALITLFFDEGDEETARHVRQCPICQAKLGEWAEFDLSMMGLFYRLECPEPDVLARHIEQRLPATEAARVKEHVAHCSYCQEDLAALHFYSPVDEEPAQESRWAAMIDGVRRLFHAQLLPPLQLQPVQRGWMSRSNESQDKKPLTYQYHTPEYDILLTVMPDASDKTDVVGQIMPLAESRTPVQGKVYFFEDGKMLEPVDIAPSGIFHLTGILSGSIHLQIEIEPDVGIELDVYLANNNGSSRHDPL